MEGAFTNSKDDLSLLENIIIIFFSFKITFDFNIFLNLYLVFYYFVIVISFEKTIKSHSINYCATITLNSTTSALNIL